MKYFTLLLFLIGWPSWRMLTWVHDRNTAVAEGTTAYAHGDATGATIAFADALAAKGQPAPDPRLLLNLAHAQARAGQLSAAHATYGRLLTGSPATLGSVARQQLAIIAAGNGEIAQAMSLLRQALLLDPTNSGARFDYEILSSYLAKKPNQPTIPAPPKAAEPDTPKPLPEKTGADKSQPAENAGTDHKGEINDSKPAPTAPNTPPARQPDAAGQPDKRRPNMAPGNVATGSRALGDGAPQPVASGEAPGSRRGIDRNSEAPGPNINAPGSRPGAEAAAPADLRLQTQRERLQAMNLSPAQARLLLETLRAQEQQYLQQLTRPALQKPDPSKPTW